MDVELYVYDLSQGLARQMSAAFLGTQIDAVYHTSLVFGGIEYSFGAGVQTSYPGKTHHGNPMQVLKLGTTDLDIETILEYLEGLKEVYTPESYDLFMHNCNNFTHDFSQFLVGKGIPDHITSLPQTVLNTPFGQMLKPQLDQAMRGVTQAPVAPSAIPKVPQTSTNTNRPGNSSSHKGVRNVTRLSDLENLLETAKTSCGVIFFTSSTCAPCKMCYPAYDSLAEELGDKVVLIKIDLNVSPEIAMKYQVRGTPHFLTLLHGEKVDEWSGADPSKLLANVRLLAQLAYPPHPHSQLRLKTLQRPHDKPVSYQKVPPLEKLLAKLGRVATEPPVIALKSFVEARSASASSLANVAMPDMAGFSRFFQASLQTIPASEVFALVDLVRVAAADPRVSGYLAEEPLSASSISKLLAYVNSLDDKCPYSLKIVTLQTACNLFSSPLFPRKALANSELSSALITLIATSLLDSGHPPVRVSAASLAFNLVSSGHKRRLETGTPGVTLSEESQVELAASIVEAIGRETSEDSLKGLLLALGLLAYGNKQDGELKEVLGALDAKSMVQSKMSEANKDLINDVSQVV